jgi:hypothetical protein
MSVSHSPSTRSYGYDPIPPTWGTNQHPRCCVCLVHEATRTLRRDYFAGASKGWNGVPMCAHCEPGVPCAAYRRGRGA